MIAYLALAIVATYSQEPSGERYPGAEAYIVYNDCLERNALELEASGEPLSDLMAGARTACVTEQLRWERLEILHRKPGISEATVRTSVKIMEQASDEVARLKVLKARAAKKRK